MISQAHVMMANKLRTEWKDIEPRVLIVLACKILKEQTKILDKDLVELYRQVNREINLLELGYEPAG